MVDVHPSHGPIHSWRDFFIHLVTITIGLLIALGLEGYVEWVHHRHLLHEAESSLREEIRGNASKMGETIARLHQSQQELKDDLTILGYVIKNRKWPESANFSIKFDITRFDNVSWDTARSTGALSFMSYREAQDYSAIYGLQSQLDPAETQAARDAIISLAPFVNLATDTPEVPAIAEAIAEEQKIELFQSQLQLVDALLAALDRKYKGYLGAPAQ